MPEITVPKEAVYSHGGVRIVCPNQCEKLGLARNEYVSCPKCGAPVQYEPVLRFGGLTVEFDVSGRVELETRWNGAKVTIDLADIDDVVVFLLKHKRIAYSTETPQA